MNERSSNYLDLDPRMYDTAKEEKWLKPGEALKEVIIGLAPHQKTKIGTGLPRDIEEQLIKFLSNNTHVFAWLPQDMPGIDPKFIYHRLSLNVSVQPVQQRKRRQVEEKTEAVREETGKLLSAEFSVRGQISNLASKPSDDKKIQRQMEDVYRLPSDGKTKAEFVKKLHEKVKAKIEHKYETYSKRANKGRKMVVFEPGDWVWVHLRKERFPSQRKSKLQPRGDGPFQVLERIGDNAYKIDLPGNYGVSATFNVSDLTLFDIGDEDHNSRASSSKEGGCDADLLAQGNEAQKGVVTRSKARRLQEDMEKRMSSLLVPIGGQSNEDKIYQVLFISD